MAEVLWYWQHDGEVCGPVGWHALAELAERGELLPGDLVRRAGGAVWVAAREAQKAYAAELAAARAAAAQAPREMSAPPAQSGYTGGRTRGLPNADAIDLNALLEPSERIFDTNQSREASQRDLYRASDPLSLVLTEEGAEPPRGPAPRPAPVQQPARARPRPVAQQQPEPSGAEIAAIIRRREAVSYGSTALVSVACVVMGPACVIVGLGFGVPFGLVGMLLAMRALQGMFSSGNPRGRGVAVAAMIAGLAEAIYFSRTVILQLAQSLGLL
jgi:hypothetical protein